MHLYLLFSEVVNDKNMMEYFDINKKGIENLIMDHMNKKVDNQWPIFTIFSLFQWKKNISS